MNPPEDERPFLWALSYRLLGNAADADEVVQEAFLRALEHPPADRTRPWRPWLVAVTANIARDRLRRRRRRGYEGSWLPSPVPDEMLDAVPTPEGRFGHRESASFAFLLALEVLSPTQRLVLILRDVFELDVAATAVALGTTAGAVKVAHHKARRALEGYESSRVPMADRTTAMAMFTTLLSAVNAQDTESARRLLADGVMAVNDGAGVYHAARVPIVGREKVTQFHLHLARAASPGLRWRLAFFNGMPGLVAAVPGAVAPVAPGWVWMAHVAPDGQIVRLYSVLADAKLTAVVFPATGEPAPDHWSALAAPD